jgi:hypothetical protein
MYKLHHVKMALLPHRVFWAEMTLVMIFSLFIFVPNSSAIDIVKFQNRSLLVHTSQPGAVTTYDVSFRHATPTTVGSIDMLFCEDPIPYMPCVVPAGLNVSNAVLAAQSGETGFTLDVKSPNHLVLTRATPTVVSNIMSTYSLSGIHNPNAVGPAYSIRLSSYASSNATGPIINIGSVRAQVTDAVMLYTQVPPMLVFCLAHKVSLTCGQTEDGNYTNMGTLDPFGVITAQAQMAVGTNASNGFVITVNGTSMKAGTHILQPIGVPTPSIPGTDQFGINLARNTTPVVGADPDGDSTDAEASADYGQSNMFKYKDGDVVAFAPAVSLVRRFTVSYIANTSPNLPAGVYTTTLTYICTGRF